MSVQYANVVGRSANDIAGDQPSTLSWGVPTGTADASVSLNNAIAAVAAAGRGTIFITGGNYTLNNQVVLASNIKLYSDGTATFKRGANMPASKGVFDLNAVSNVILEGFTIDGQVTSPTGILYSSAQSNGPLWSTLTLNTSIWIHGGCSNITLDDVTIQHTGGYSILIDTTTSNAGISNILINGCLIWNNRPFLFGDSGSENYGAWTGGILMANDGSSFTGTIQNVTITATSFYCITGHAAWMHGNSNTILNSGIKIIGNHFQDIGLDGIQMSNCTGAVVQGNTGRRIGYISLSDSTVGTPKWYSGTQGSIPACFLDTGGVVLNSTYSNNTCVSVNGQACNLDGFGYGSVAGNAFRIPSPTDQEYSGDSITSCGPTGAIGQDWMAGIQSSNTNGTAQGGNYVTISGNNILGFGGNAIGLFAFRNGSVIGNHITAPPFGAYTVASQAVPIQISNIGGGATSPATPTANYRSYNNVLTGNIINWNPGTLAAAIQEIPTYDGVTWNFASTDGNTIFGNTISGNIFEVSVAAPLTTTGHTFSTVAPGQTVSSKSIIQREGTGSGAVLKVYSDSGQKLALADQASGGVTKVVFGGGGSSYTSTPTVVCAAPIGGGTTATIAAWLSGTAVGGFWISSPGSGYAPGETPAFTITGGGGSGASGSGLCVASSLLLVTHQGNSGSGNIATGNRSSANVPDSIATSAQLADGMIAFTNSTYQDSVAIQLISAGYCLFRYAAGVGQPQWSNSLSAGIPVWNNIGAGGGGGGGSPGGTTGSVQYNSGGGSPTFQGDSNLIWDSIHQFLTIFAGSATPLQYYALRLIDAAVTYSLFVRMASIGGTAGSCSIYTNAAAALAFGTNLAEAFRIDTSQRVIFGAAAATASGSIVEVHGGSGNPVLAIIGGYAYSDQGFSTPFTGGNAFNATAGGGFTGGTVTLSSASFQACQGNVSSTPTGGAWFRSFFAGKYIQVGTNSGVPTATSGDTINNGAVYYDTGLNQLLGLINGTWQNLGPGSGGTPGGPANSLQVNVSSAFQGYAALTWTNSTQLLSVAGIVNTAAIAVTQGYIQSLQGLLVPSGGGTTSYQAIHVASGGGVWARSCFSQIYTQLGSNSGVPTATSGDSVTTSGCCYWDTGLAALRVYNGSSWISLGTAAAAGSTTQIQVNNGGAFAGYANLTWNSGVNQLTVNGAVVSSTLQATSSAFNAISATGGVSASTIQATAAASIYNAIAAVNGGISCGTGSAGGFYVGSTKVIDNSANLSVNGISAVSAVLSGGITATGFNPTGHTGQGYTIVIAGGFTVGGTTFHDINFTGGALTSVS